MCNLLSYINNECRIYQTYILHLLIVYSIIQSIAEYNPKKSAVDRGFTRKMKV